MYLCVYRIRGHHKIQDLLSLVVYEVIRVPMNGGVVYVPVDDLTIPCSRILCK